jgi:putative ABC transport system permease protein
MRRDFARALRALRRTPLFAAVAAAIIAIGIGVVSIVLGVIDAAFFRALPVPNAERIVAIYSHDPRDGRQKATRANSFAVYLDLRRLVQGLDGLAAYSVDYVSSHDDGRTLLATFVSGNYFSVLGVRPLRGRFILPDEEMPPGTHPVAVISERLWRSSFGGEEEIAGRQLDIGVARFTVVGVAREEFNGLQSEGRTDIWLPYTMAGEATARSFAYDDRTLRVANIVGRRKSGSTIPRVQASVDDVSAFLVAAYPSTDSSLALRVASKSRLVSLSDFPQAFLSMVFVLALVALVYLAACSNVATLLLARAVARRREIGILLCIGAPRRRIVLQSLWEPALLALTGAALGIGIAYVLGKALSQVATFSAVVPRIDTRFSLMVAGLSIVTALECGLLPALIASRHDPLEVLRGAVTSRLFGLRLGPSSLLLVGQVAISVIVIVNASVLLEAAGEQSRLGPGFDAANVLVADVTMPRGMTPMEQRAGVLEMITRIGALPGVNSASIAIGAPLYRSTSREDILRGDGVNPLGDRSVSTQRIGVGYFRTLGLRMLRGREFAINDPLEADSRSGRDELVILNQAMARKLWKDQDPIGRHVLIGRGRAPAIVIGIVPDVRDVSVFETMPRAYLPTLGKGEPLIQLIVHVGARSAGASAAMRGVLADVWKSREAPRVQSALDLRSQATELTRTAGIAIAFCCAITTLVVGLGLYGAVVTWAEQKRRDMSIRIALGARSADLFRVMLAAIGRLLGIGLAAGAAGTFLVLRVERASFGPLFDAGLVPIAGAAALFTTIVALAAYFPSRRILALSPAIELRA